MGVNKAILMGNVGKDPEMKYTTSNLAIASLSLATSEKRKDSQSGEWVSHTEWHRVTCFGKLAEFCSKYLKKGTSIYIEGKIRTNKWQDKDGNTRYTTEILGEKIEFAGNKQDNNSSYSNNNQAQNFQTADKVAMNSEPTSAPVASFEDDDIPF